MASSTSSIEDINSYSTRLDKPLPQCGPKISPATDLVQNITVLEEQTAFEPVSHCHFDPKLSRISAAAAAASALRRFSLVPSYSTRKNTVYGLTYGPTEEEIVNQ